MINARDGCLKIDCRENEVYVFDPRGNAASRFEKSLIYELFGAKPCLTPGVYSPLTPLSKVYVNALATMYRLINCFNSAEIFVFIDDVSAEHVEELRVLNSLIKKHGFSLDKLLVIDFKKAISTAREIVKIRSEIEKIRSKRDFGENDYSSYSALSSRLDSLLSTLIRLLNGEVESVVKIYEAVKEVQQNPINRLNGDAILLNQELTRIFVEKIYGLFKPYGIEPKCVNLSSITAKVDEPGFKELLFTISSFLGQRGCSSKTIVNGEDYVIAIHLLNLDFIAIDVV